MRDAQLRQTDYEGLGVDAVRHWVDGPSSLLHVQNSENFVFRFGKRDPKNGQYDWFYLRLSHSGHRSYDQLLAELEFVSHLAKEGCHVCCPVHSMRGNLVEPLIYNRTPFHACVFEAAPGARLDSDFSTWDQSLFHEWGSSLAAIHAASKNFRLSETRRFRWDEDDIFLNAQTYIPVEETVARQELAQVLDWLGNLSSDAEQFGLIHGDLCSANFHWDGKHITTFDFDDSSYHWFVYDLVCAMAPMVFHPDRDLYRQWFIEGYQRLNTLPGTWQSDFQWFLRLRGLYLFILNLRNWDGPLEEHPKRGLLNMLRNSFERPLVW